MRIISLALSAASLLVLGLTMHAGLKAGHGQTFLMSHLYWSFASIGIVALTLTLCLMFIFKMHGIMHDLIRRLDAKFPEEGNKP
jgi:hypothetical protein